MDVAAPDLAADPRVLELREAVLAAAPGGARATGAGTKDALARGAGLDLRALAGVRAYDPAEFTVTALAGTPVAALERELARHGQALPFEPPLAAAGATLGGTVAAGLSGAGRQRYGGVRDFLLGLRFLDGRGRLVTGGGRVVKNAAGFDLPKLMVGALGRYGLLLELTFKVFPAPEATATIVADLPDATTALAALAILDGGPLEPAALDLVPPGKLRARFAGRRAALPARLARARDAIGGGAILEGEADRAHWDRAREFAWLPAGLGLVKVALEPSALARLEPALAAEGAPRRASAAGHLLWLGWPAARADALHALLAEHGLRGVALRGRWPGPLLGAAPGGAFAARVAAALDPDGRFAWAAP